MTRPWPRPGRATALAAAFTALTACGGNDEPPTPAAFELQQARPAAHAGTLRAGPESGTGTELRPPDGFSALPYCLVRMADLLHANGGRYTMNLAFAPGSGQVLALTLAAHESSWFVVAFDPPTTAAQVDLGHRRLRLHALQGAQGPEPAWVATLTGHATFPAAVGSGSCG